MGFIMSEEIEYKDAKISQEILDYLTKGLDWNIPDIDLSDSAYELPPELLEALQKGPNILTDDSLTTAKFDDKAREYGKIEGNGTFDKILESIKAHLWVEYNKGRITGAEYAQAFVTLVQGALQNAVQFLISRDKAYWDAVIAQTQAAIAALEFQTKKMQYLLARIQVYLMRAQYASEVMKLGIADKQYGTMVLNDTLSTNKDNREERTTSKQIEVMTQQINSYQRKDERDTIKLQTDAWSVTKGIAEDTAVPTPLANPAIVTSMTKALKNVGLS